ncbi:MAG TPA: DUF72 domain-containing protein [Candidatus Dormibacteraeota bacterium]|nr:DUF72 domain-containing protein [Candidatus Dormibacteraeota bacterium]
MGALYAGTSGFSYASWKGVFYPERLPAAKMLAYYAERLNGVELNGSFYRMPPPEALARWAAGTPEGFCFCFKAHRALTYSAAAFDKEGLAREVGPRLGGLGRRLGPALVQFPPTRERDPDLLDRLLAALGIRAAVEFRHESWFAEDVYGVLRRHGAGLVVTDQDKWPRAPRVEVSGLAYYRLRRDYDQAALDEWRRELRAEAAARDELHVYFRHEPEAPARAAHILGV